MQFSFDGSSEELTAVFGLIRGEAAATLSDEQLAKLKAAQATRHTATGELQAAVDHAAPKT